jgi:hypothetical protein
MFSSLKSAHYKSALATANFCAYPEEQGTVAKETTKITLSFHGF